MGSLDFFVVGAGLAPALGGGDRKGRPYRCGHARMLIKWSNIQEGDVPLENIEALCAALERYRGYF